MAPHDGHYDPHYDPHYVGTWEPGSGYTAVYPPFHASYDTYPQYPAGPHGPHGQGYGNNGASPVRRGSLSSYGSTLSLEEGASMGTDGVWMPPPPPSPGYVHCGYPPHEGHGYYEHASVYGPPQHTMGPPGCYYGPPAPFHMPMPMPMPMAFPTMDEGPDAAPHDHDGDGQEWAEGAAMLTEYPGCPDGSAPAQEEGHLQGAEGSATGPPPAYEKPLHAAGTGTSQPVVFTVADTVVPWGTDDPCCHGPWRWPKQPPKHVFLVWRPSRRGIHFSPRPIHTHTLGVTTRNNLLTPFKSPPLPILCLSAPAQMCFARRDVHSLHPFFSFP